MKSNPVYRVCTKVLFAPIILFGLYVQFHGDFGPGGGFQAGVIVAAAFVLYGLVFGIKAARRLAPARAVFAAMVAGVSLYTGVGVFTWLRGGNYLDYNFIDYYDPARGQHIGIILVELGVGITVTSVMLALFFTFAGYRSVIDETGGDEDKTRSDGDETAEESVDA